jgi:16S rRNA A1518/A1519 N6-dimethyltransferase RsmA/KsgA/DIM1 with predicted DNA glycosylase/AP lyase activity
MRARALGQNFLRNRRTARRVAHLAGPDPDLLCVDLGAGNGMVTDACLLRNGPILAIELDGRLVQGLRNRFAEEDRITVLEADLLAAPLPDVPFVVAANPPFNASTALVRRWFLAEQFRSGAIIVEKPFGRRVSGSFGATKLSLSFAPYLDMDLPFEVRPAEFTPQPQVHAAILTAARRMEPSVPWSERDRYWQFINYVFERSQHQVGEAIAPLRLDAIPARVRTTAVRDLDVAAASRLYAAAVDAGNRVWARIQGFEDALGATRRTPFESGAPLPDRPTRRPPRRDDRR